MSIIEPRTSVVTLYQGDYLDRIRHIEREYDELVKSEKGSTLLLGEVSKAAEKLAEHEALVAEADESALHVKVRAIRRSAYREMADAHPPRTGDDVDPSIALADAKMAVNEKTFRLVLVPAAIVDITKGGEVTTWDEMAEDDREEFLDTISESDFELLFLHAFGLVNNFASAPKALALPASQVSQTSAKS